MVGAKGGKMVFGSATRTENEQIEALRGIGRLTNGGGTKSQTTAAKTIGVQSTSVNGKARISMNIGNPSHQSCNRPNQNGSCPCPNTKFISGYCIPNAAGSD